MNIERYLRDNSGIFFLRARIDKRNCDVDVRLRVILGAEAEG